MCRLIFARREALPLLVAKVDTVGILLRLVFSFNAIPALFFHVLAPDQPVLIVAILVAVQVIGFWTSYGATATGGGGGE